jgi:hypothetical protein
MMEFLTLFILPPGNIRKTIHELRVKSFREGGGTKLGGVPDGIILGMYEMPKVRSSIEGNSLVKKNGNEVHFPIKTIERFKEAAEFLLESIPDLLVFSEIRFLDGFSFLLPIESIDTLSITNRLPEFEHRCALSSLRPSPIPSKFGIFLSETRLGYTTIENAISFRHMELTLWQGIADDSLESMRCFELAAVPRRIGPRKPKGDSRISG